MTVKHAFRPLFAALVALFLFAAQGFAFFFYTSNFNDGLVRFNDDGTGQTTLVAGGAGQPVEVDTTNNDVYYMSGLNITNYDISSTSTSTVVTENAAVPGLALDVPNTYIYYSVQGAPGNRFIKRIQFDGSGQQTIVTLTNFDLPVRTAYDSTNSRVYWTDIGSGSTGVRYRNADGSGGNVNIGVSTAASGLDIDNTNQKVYWTEPNNNLIRRSNLNGSSAETLVSTSAQPWNVEVDEVNSILYWVQGDGSSTSSPRAVYRSNLDGSSPTFLFNSINGSFDIAFDTIPEPSTYALIVSLIGLGIAIVARKRRQKAL